MDIDTQALRIAADNTPPGKPYAELSPEQHARLSEIEDDIAHLLNEWRGIVSDTMPAIPLYRVLVLPY